MGSFSVKTFTSFRVLVFLVRFIHIRVSKTELGTYFYMPSFLIFPLVYIFILSIEKRPKNLNLNIYSLSHTVTEFSVNIFGISRVLDSLVP